MNRFKLFYFVIFIISLYKINAQISDKRLCVDEECKVPISLAKTLLRYSSPDSRILSFAPNADITIYSKSAGSREDLWGGEINGKRGYVPKHMVRETKVLQKPTILVDTEFSNDTETKQVPSPDKVQEPYEVVDGTTIYLNPQEVISPTSTDSPIQSTALPADTNKVTQPNVAAEAPQTVPSYTEPNQNQEVPSSLPDSPQIQETPEIKSGEASLGDEPAEVTDSDEEEEEGEIDLDDDESDDEDGDEESEEPEESSESAQGEKNESTILETHSESTELKSDFSTESTQNQSEEIKAETAEIEDSVKESEAATEEVKPEAAEEVTENLKLEPVESQVTTEPAIISSEKETHTDNVLNVETSEEVIQQNEDVTSYEPPPHIEATTISSEMEVPPPFDESFEVTPNPLEAKSEETNSVKDTIPTLPPLGLFSQSVPDPILATDAKNELPEDNVQNEQQTSEEIIEEAEHDVSQEVVEEVQPVESDVGIDSPVSAEDESAEEETTQTVESTEEEKVEETTGSGFLAGVMSLFGSNSEESVNEREKVAENEEPTIEQLPHFEEKHIEGDDLLSVDSQEPFCDATSCPKIEANDTPVVSGGMDLFNFNSDVFLYLVTTAISVIIFLFGYIAFDKSKREGPLIAKINNLEKQLLIILKENQILQEKVATESGYETNDLVSNEVVENLKQELVEMVNIKSALEEHIQSLEKELENSTEVGMELNRMLSEILSSEGGSDVLKANVEHLQRQLVEQQSTINSVNETLAITNTENHELRLELELSNKKVLDLQAELDKLLLNVLKIEEEKETQQSTLENELVNVRQKYEEINKKLKLKEEDYSTELKQLKNGLNQTERKLELKTKEHGVLTETLKQLKIIKNNDESTLQNLLEVSGIKAELQLLKAENHRFNVKLQQEQEMKVSCEKKAQISVEEARLLKEKYDEVDKLRVEAQTKLEVLSNYFKDREAQLQKEISKHEALWAEKEGEATSTTERIKFMQEQLQNYKAQTESLKQEIMSQEIELKSQISVLEKKAHENWVGVRQAERKLEEAKQEAAQLRHRLTLRERAIHEDKNQHRLQSPIEQNGDMPVSPLESPASPPLLYNPRDHITKSPPIPGLPPFLPPPPGVPFMPPPLHHGHGVPPFIPPPPPNMFPGDHRPPPLGRMSSPPLNSRYSPSSRGYSPYERNSSSPSDSEYGTSPPHRRGYSPFNSRGDDRRDYKRPLPGRTNGRNLMKGGGSSGSGHSNESLEKINRQQSKV